MGDPRFDAEHWHLPTNPLFGFIEIPAGPFMMGSDKRRDGQAFSAELPQHETNLPGYYLARWPVTVAQFAAFVEASGHQPADPNCLKGIANHPVVRISRREAMAYSCWLNERLRKLTHERLAKEKPLLQSERRFWEGLADGSLGVGLPSEVEWEKAARGDESRIYPWGNELDPNRANYSNTGLNTTSAVGCFTGGASPYGCEEMSGNVWEWTRSLFGDYPYPQEGPERQARENMNAPDNVSRVLRGGAFYSDAGNVRCACRLDFNPGYRSADFGFRVVVSPLVFSDR
ncbi:MAG: formylglycine-generating enzyme family protein [Synechococcaceae cyanobacterium SM1_2_3]|nr:formylglycine-generating enzyme family protein [Synechococcaceae cyanobacterium SM1_2_3]